MSEGETKRPPRLKLPVITEELDRQVDRGMLFNYGMHTEALDRNHELATFVFAGLELLMQKGIITKDELGQMAGLVRVQLDKQHWTRTHGYAFNGNEDSKYEPQKSRMIDCDARHHLCKAACCHFEFPLQLDDIQEGVVKWDLGKPYWIRKHEGGRCVHQQVDSGRCGVFENRPLTCRIYTCENDPRVWHDFEKRIPNVESIERILNHHEDRKMMMVDVKVEKMAVEVQRIMMDPPPEKP